MIFALTTTFWKRSQATNNKDHKCYSKEDNRSGPKAFLKPESIILLTFYTTITLRAHLKWNNQFLKLHRLQPKIPYDGNEIFFTSTIIRWKLKHSLSSRGWHQLQPLRPKPKTRDHMLFGGFPFQLVLGDRMLPGTPTHARLCVCVLKQVSIVVCVCVFFFLALPYHFLYKSSSSFRYAV